MHRLVGKGTEFAAQCRDHPAGKVEIAFFRGSKVLLHRDHLLLGDETVPAAERLGVLGRVGIIGCHVLPHDVGGVAGDVEAGLEAILQLHSGNRFGADGVPGSVLCCDQLAGFGYLVFVRHLQFLGVY